MDKAKFYYLFIKKKFGAHLAACGILVAQPGIEPAPSAVTAQIPNHWTAREFPKLNFAWKVKGIRIVKTILRASLVAQWLRIRLPVQGTRVRALVLEDPTCRRATKPESHNY